MSRLYLRDEPQLEDQGLRCFGCYPSEGALLKMAYQADFPFVYRLTWLPDHEAFRTALLRKKGRSMLAASTFPLNSPSLVLAPEPVTRRDPWATDITGATKIARRIRNSLGKA